MKILEIKPTKEQIIAALSAEDMIFMRIYLYDRFDNLIVAKGKCRNVDPGTVFAAACDVLFSTFRKKHLKFPRWIHKCDDVDAIMKRIADRIVNNARNLWSNKYAHNLLDTLDQIQHKIKAYMSFNQTQSIHDELDVEKMIKNDLHSFMLQMKQMIQAGGDENEQAYRLLEKNKDLLRVNVDRLIKKWESDAVAASIIPRDMPTVYQPVQLTFEFVTA